MSKPFVFEKPTGVKDYVPDTVELLRAVEQRVLACMQAWGYQQIVTPTLEYYDTVGIASATSDAKLFKLLDKKGTTLVMRSDMTAPIARVMNSLLKEEPLPARISYHSNVFRAIEEEAGRDSEFFQTGVELVGDGGPDADAEAIALAVHCLKAIGLESFKIAIGHIGYLNGVLEASLPGRPDDQTSLKEDLLRRDYVGYRKRVAGLPIDDGGKRRLEAVLTMRGGREVCGRPEAQDGGGSAAGAIGHLREVLAVLDEYGVSEHIMIDLTLIGHFSYYTGVTFEGYSGHLGFPVLSGGRYDNLLAQFGRALPATGFALETNRILDIVAGLVEPAYRVLVLYEKARRREALQTALDLRRRQGVTVVAQCVDGAPGAAGRAEPAGDGEWRYAGRTYQDVIEFTGNGQREE